MIKAVIWTIIVILVVIAGAILLIISNNQGIAVAETGDSPFEAPIIPEGTGQIEHTVFISASGFSPNTLEINSGDIVSWRNEDTSTHWPASNNHPTHTLYPGFDVGSPIEQGERYTFVFQQKGTWGYHDHLNPSRTGTIVVN